MIKNLISVYSPLSSSRIIVYMLQNTEYQISPYLKWYWRTQDFSRVMYRRQLEKTGPARMLRLAALAGMVFQILSGFALIGLGLTSVLAGGLYFGLALLISYPAVWAHLVIVPLWLGREVITKPKEQKAVSESSAVFEKFKGHKIAIAGSYGKTSMKELLLTVLSEGRKVAATPANKNVSVSHAVFAKKLNGDEDILIIEYGEGAPGDVVRFAETTQPTHGVITGLAPAHLDHYKTLQAAGEDIFSLAKYLKDKNIYVNGESESATEFIKKEFHIYDRDGALGWKLSDVKLGMDGTWFTLTKDKKTLKLHSRLLGRHQLGPLSLAAALASELGLTSEQIITGIAKTKPFEHRMQPYQLNDAWVIDDTYNGNIEGIRAGTELLKELPAGRKLYVTPGLVDQGDETEKIHEKMGELIAAAGPNIVVLMQNSVTHFIKKGLNTANFTGELRIEPDPLAFYKNLDQHVAAGDLVMLQNDWPDNYA